MQSLALFAAAALAAAHAQKQESFRRGTASSIPLTGLSAKRFTTADGKEGWKVEIPGRRVLATPAVIDGTVFVGGGFGSHEFYAFDAATGKARWAIRVSDDGPTAAVVSDGYVVFNTESCTIFVVDAKTGRQIWSRWLGDPLMSQPAVADGMVYMAYPGQGGHRLIAMSLQNGDTRWETPIAGDVISAPVIAKDAVFLSTNDGTVYKILRQDGKLEWKEQMHATSAPTIDDAGSVHVAKGNPRGAGPRTEGLQKLRASSGAADGQPMAQRPADHLDPEIQKHSEYAKENAKDDSSVGFGGGAPVAAKAAPAEANLGQGSVKGLWQFQGSRPLVRDGKSFATRGDTLQALDANGKVLWEDKMAGDLRRSGGQLASPPAYAGGKLVVGTLSGTIQAYDAQSGKRAFTIPIGEPIRFQPVLAGGRVFVGTERGSLVAVATGDASLDRWTMWGGGARHNGAE